MTDHYQQSIAALVARIEQDEQAFVQTMAKRKMLVNELCVEAGVEPRYPNVTEAPSAATPRPSSTPGGIKSDEFFGKPLAGSIKRVLEMRRISGNGPASVEEIYRALLAGGFDFATKNQDQNIQGLTVSIGKNSAVFVKLPNGQVGLKEWYPNARPRATARRDTPESDGGEEEQQEENK